MYSIGRLSLSAFCNFSDITLDIVRPSIVSMSFISLLFLSIQHIRPAEHSTIFTPYNTFNVPGQGGPSGE